MRANYAMIGMALLPSLVLADGFADRVDAIYADATEVVKTQIADGRAKGGEKALFISYRLTDQASGGPVAQVLELLETGWSANFEFGGELDGLVLIAVDDDGGLKGVVSVKTKAAENYHGGGDLMSYLQSWKVKRPDGVYLTARQMGHFATSGMLAHK